MAIEWRRRHHSDTGWFAFDGAYLRGQVAMYDTGGSPFYRGYLSGRPVTGDHPDPADAQREVEAALAEAQGRPS